MAKHQNELAPTQAAGLPAALMERMAADVGKGTSQDQSDNLVPLIYVLQALSPQVNERKPDYIKGAKSGDIWLRNANNPIVPGATGILFQPCYFFKDWVEWKPRDSGGGYIGRHESLPEDATQQADPKNANRVRFIRPNGNEVIETRYHVGRVILGAGHALPYVIPMTSSGHTVSRQWMFMMNNVQIGGKPAPSFGTLWRLKTKERSNASGTWFTWDISPAEAVPGISVVTPQGVFVASMDDYERGQRLFNSFEAGEQKAGAPEQHLDEGAAEGAM